MDNYSGGQGDGRLSNLASTPGEFAPLNGPPNGGTLPGYQNNGIPILHGNPYGPAITNGQPNCQPGQTGYALGDDRIPGQTVDNPTFGVSQIAGDGAASGVKALGKTDLFLQQNGDRVFWDQGNNPPESGK
jgi:hypothetical protein